MFFFVSSHQEGDKDMVLLPDNNKLNAVYFIREDIKIILNMFRLKIERKSYLYCLSQLLHSMCNLLNK